MTGISIQVLTVASPGPDQGAIPIWFSGENRCCFCAWVLENNTGYRIRDLTDAGDCIGFMNDRVGR